MKISCYSILFLTGVTQGVSGVVDNLTKLDSHYI